MSIVSYSQLDQIMAKLYKTVNSVNCIILNLKDFIIV